jgi:hypothetical protein
MYVSNELCQVRLTLAKYRFMSALKDMTDMLVAAVIILAVACQHTLHDIAYRLSLSLDQQMQVIRHQAIGIEEEAGLGLLFGQKLEELSVVICGMEDVAPVIAATHDMVKPSRDLNSRLSRHGRELYQRSHKSQNRMSDPVFLSVPNGSSISVSVFTDSDVGWASFSPKPKNIHTHMLAASTPMLHKIDLRIFPS